MTNMDFGFAYKAFNEPLNCWDTSSVTSMYYMFGRSHFNQPIDSWDVSKVTAMQSMFYSTDFNQCLTSWKDKTHDDVDVTSMFHLSNSCDQNVGPWCQKACSSGRKLDSKSVPSGTISLCK